MDINENKLELLKYYILKLEDDNSRTKEYSNIEMIDKIKTMIKNEVDKKI